VIEWSAPIGFGPPLHQHDGEDEAFYLLAGPANGELRRPFPGRSARVTSCSCRAASRTPSWSATARRHGLQITAPAGFEEFAAEVGRRRPGAPACLTRKPPDLPRLITASQRHGHQILGPPPSPGHDRETAG